MSPSITLSASMRRRLAQDPAFRDWIAWLGSPALAERLEQQRLLRLRMDAGLPREALATIPADLFVNALTMAPTFFDGKALTLMRSLLPQTTTALEWYTRDWATTPGGSPRLHRRIMQVLHSVLAPVP